MKLYPPIIVPIIVKKKIDSALKIVCLCSIRNEVFEATRYNTQRY